MEGKNSHNKYVAIIAYSDECCIKAIAKKLNISIYNNSTSKKTIVIVSGNIVDAYKINIKSTNLINVGKIYPIRLSNQFTFIERAIQICKTWNIKKVKVITCSKYFAFFQKSLKKQNIKFTLLGKELNGCKKDNMFKWLKRKAQGLVMFVGLKLIYFKNRLIFVLERLGFIFVR